MPFNLNQPASTKDGAIQFRQSALSEQVVALPAPCAQDAADYECPATPTAVRLVRVVTPNGRVHE